MSARRPVVSLLAALGLAAGLLAGPQMVEAAGVDEAQREVDRTLSELEQLRDQLGQIDEDYGAALDRQDELAVEIAAAQEEVDRMAAELGDVEALLADIAVARFTSGGTSELSPIFSDAATYVAAQQRDALSRMALDSGEADADDLEALLDDLSDARDALARKQEEAAQIVATLDAKRQEFAELETVYLEKYEQAKTELGEAKLEAEEERRAAAARAAQQPPADSGGAATSGSPGRGGGGSSGGSTGGSDGSSGGSSGGSSYVPPVSGKAGIAVSAAMSQLGVPYRFAAEEPGVAFDCSGLTKWAWGRAGVYLPHQSGAQYASTPHVPRDQAQPGDLIFYYSPIGYVGLYLGGGQMVHAPATGDVVKVVTVHWNKVVGVSRPG